MTRYSKVVLLFSSVILFGANAFAQVDYRAYQSPVKHQQNRGTCTAFSILAAMETFQGFPVDLSEQYVYAQAKMKYYKEMPEYTEGAMLWFYIDVLESMGTVREDQDPYNPNAPVWDEEATGFEKMKKDLQGNIIDYLKISNKFAYKLQPDMYTYLQGADAANVDYLKKRLDEGIKAIPVGYNVNGQYWFDHPASASNPIDIKDYVKFSDGLSEYDLGIAKLMYGNELFSKVHTGEIEAFYSNEALACEEGHAVAIVGYNDTGFLIKNSWGTDWGDKGYGWISYDYHRLMCDEALILSWGRVHVYDAIAEDDGGWNTTDFYLKSSPYYYENDFLKSKGKGIAVSFVYHGEAQMPRFSEIEIKVYDINGKLLETRYGNTGGIFDGRETGYGTFILSADTPNYPTCAKLVVRFKTSKGREFTNTYYQIVPQCKEYRAG